MRIYEPNYCDFSASLHNRARYWKQCESRPAQYINGQLYRRCADRRHCADPCGKMRRSHNWFFALDTAAFGLPMRMVVHNSVAYHRCVFTVDVSACVLERVRWLASGTCAAYIRVVNMKTKCCTIYRGKTRYELRLQAYASCMCDACARVLGRNFQL